jgi:hypothetical protein
MLLASPPVSGQEANGNETEKPEKKYFLAFQMPFFDIIYSELLNTKYRSYDVNYELSIDPAMNMAFGIKISESWWIMPTFGFDLHFDNLDSWVHAGVGARADLPLRKGVAFCGFSLEYAFQKFTSDARIPYTAHGVFLSGFTGAEYLVTDYFGIGGRVQFGLFWSRLLSDGPIIYAGNDVNQDSLGVLFQLLMSMSFYF